MRQDVSDQGWISDRDRPVGAPSGTDPADLLVAARSGWYLAGETSRPLLTPLRKRSMRPVADGVYGTVSAARQQEMSGLEFVQGLAGRTLPLNTIARTLGYDVIEAVNGRVVIVAEPDDTLLNPAGTVHGGFSATLLDSCMGLAIQSTLEKGIGQTTLEFKISLVRPIT